MSENIRCPAIVVNHHIDARNLVGVFSLVKFDSLRQDFILQFRLSWNALTLLLHYSPGIQMEITDRSHHFWLPSFT